METNKRRKDLKIKIRKVSTEAGKQYEIQGNITDFSIKIGDDTKQARFDVSREVEKQEVIMIGKLHAHEKHSVSDSSTQRARVEHATTSRQSYKSMEDGLPNGIPKLYWPKDHAEEEGWTLELSRQTLREAGLTFATVTRKNHTELRKETLEDKRSRTGAVCNN